MRLGWVVDVINFVGWRGGRRTKDEGEDVEVATGNRKAAFVISLCSGEKSGEDIRVVEGGGESREEERRDLTSVEEEVVVPQW